MQPLVRLSIATDCFFPSLLSETVSLSLQFTNTERWSKSLVTIMRILSWVQSKISGNQEKKRSVVGSSSSRRSSIPDDRKEEFSDWPQCLLAIGTLGNTDIKEETERQNASENSRSSESQLDFSIEEVIKLQKELMKLLSRKSKSKTSTDGSETGGGERANLPLNRFLNCPSSLEVERKICNEVGSGENNGDLSPDSRIILNKARDILADKRNTIKQKSFMFLLKKVFLCRSGFAPTPSLRDPISETKMEKIMRILLQNKIYTQSSTTMLAKKYLETKSMGKLEYKDKAKEKAKEKEEDGCKWVKTDSDFIVLEL